MRKPVRISAPSKERRPLQCRKERPPVRSTAAICVAVCCQTPNDFVGLDVCSIKMLLLPFLLK
jgi:hypothetical protein